MAVLVFVPAAGATVYSDAVLAHGPLAYWRFEDLASNNGDVALSEVNNATYQGTYLGNDVTLVSDPLAPVGLGQSMGLHPTAQALSHVAASDVGLPIGSDDRTMMGWAKTIYATAISPIVNYGVWNFTQLSFLGNALTNPSVTQYGASVVNPSNMTDGQWHFIVATQSGGSWTVYQDGGAGVTGAMGTNTTLTGIVTIGRQPLHGYDLIGSIDEVAVFDKVLTQTEIQDLYDAAFVVPDPIPEPATLSLLALGGVGMLRRKRRTA